jgi:hypothetical protein
MIILMTLLIAGASMAFAVHQWRRGYHLIAIGFITFACLIACVAIEAAKNDQNAEATEVLRQPQAYDHQTFVPVRDISDARAARQAALEKQKRNWAPAIGKTSI